MDGRTGLRRKGTKTKFTNIYKEQEITESQGCQPNKGASHIE